MARAIWEEGFALHVWARRESSAAPFRSLGATVHDNPVSLAATVDLIALCVVSGADVEQLLFEGGALEAMRPGSILVVHTTMDPSACRAIAGARGLVFLDAPVSGGGPAAAERKLLVLVGGEAEALRRSLPVLRAYGDPVVHLGAVGAGQTCKILNNLLLNTNLAAATFALQLADALGLDRSRIREVILKGTGRSYALEALDKTLIPGQLDPTLGRKDIALGAALAQGCPNSITEPIGIMTRLASLGREDLAGHPAPTRLRST
jgi:3-hydroxyisobutyrate dehydrogenase-like beta-hydroxyacid dehydrogenase